MYNKNQKVETHKEFAYAKLSIKDLRMKKNRATRWALAKEENNIKTFRHIKYKRHSAQRKHALKAELV